MNDIIDPNIVELRRLASSVKVQAMTGQSIRVDEKGNSLGALQLGDSVSIGDIVFVASNSSLQLSSNDMIESRADEHSQYAQSLYEMGHDFLQGGPKGCVFSFVDTEAFRSGPQKKDLATLIHHLEEIGNEFAHLGKDPMAMQEGPQTFFSRILAADYARQNLIHEVALLIPESTARKLGVVALFEHNDALVIACESMTIPKLRELTETVGRPTNMHWVDMTCLRELLERVYAVPN